MGKHKGEVERKPQNMQVRKCKVSTEAPFLPSPEGSFSLHLADNVSPPSPFWVLTPRSSGARTPSRASSQMGFSSSVYKPCTLTCLCTRSGMLRPSCCKHTRHTTISHHEHQFCADLPPHPGTVMVPPDDAVFLDFDFKPCTVRARSFHH